MIDKEPAARVVVSKGKAWQRIHRDAKVAGEKIHLLFRRHEDASFEIGTFAFPALKETTGYSNTCLTQDETRTPAGWLSTQQLEDELFDAALDETMSNPKRAATAHAQIDAYFATDCDGGERQHRQSLLRLLGLLRPNLAELLGEPSSLG
jgi:hypothetical protein